MKPLTLGKGQTQKSAFLKPSHCIMLRKCYKMPNKNTGLMQLSPGSNESLRDEDLEMPSTEVNSNLCFCNKTTVNTLHAV